MVKVCLCPSFIKAFGDVIAAACPLPEKKKNDDIIVCLGSILPPFPPSAGCGWNASLHQKGDK